jgi:hypothetical protein
MFRGIHPYYYPKGTAMKTRKPSHLQLRDLAFNADGDPQCPCCGEAKPLRQYGEWCRGQIYWSRPFCSIGCHNAWHYA